MKILYKIFLVLLIFIAVQQFCRSQTRGFNMNKTVADFPNDPEWDLPTPSEKEQHAIQQILNQPFYFLGRGVQCYAFISKDQKSVLKIFKHYHMGPSSRLLRQLPLTKSLNKLRKMTLDERKKRMRSIFESLKIATLDLKQETGTLFVHLNTTHERFPSLQVFDAIGCAHVLSLDQTPFVLQKKAELLYPTLEKALASENYEDSKQMLFKLVDLIISRSKKGICNSDPVLKRNLGCIKDKAIEIDIGSFSKNPFLSSDCAIKREIIYETLELKEWLESKSLPLKKELEGYLKTLLSEESGGDPRE